MNNKIVVKASIITGIAVCSAAGAMAALTTKRSKAKKMVRKAGQKIELVSSMLQSVADMTK